MHTLVDSVKHLYSYSTLDKRVPTRAYFCCPSFLSRSMCKKSLENTVSEVKNLCEPTTGEMER